MDCFEDKEFIEHLSNEDIERLNEFADYINQEMINRYGELFEADKDVPFVEHIHKENVSVTMN